MTPGQLTAITVTTFQARFLIAPNKLVKTLILGVLAGAQCKCCMAICGGRLNVWSTLESQSPDQRKAARAGQAVLLWPKSMKPKEIPPHLDLTVRVGCSLAYETTGTASLLLNLKLQPRDSRHVLFEALALGDHLVGEEFEDSHGNCLTRVELRPGSNCVRHDAIVAISSKPDNADYAVTDPGPPSAIPVSLLRYTLPSRYCDSDRLTDFAWKEFGHIEHGLPRVTAISRWIHDNIEYRYMSGRPDLSAADVLHRGYGVCRDFAHLAIALNRTFNLPARYVTGYLPDVGFPDPDNHMDFHAYSEVYVGGTWFTSDARFHAPRIGRIQLAYGQDAVDGAFSTIYGAATLAYFEVWAYQVARGTVGVGDPIDLTKRLDNEWTVRSI